MAGRGNSRLLAVWSEDPVLSAITPLGLAAACGAGLVVDLHDRFGGGRSVTEILEEGPSPSELTPSHRGVAVLRGGGASIEQADEVARLLARYWPAVVVAAPTRDWAGPLAPVHGLLPGCLAPRSDGAAVWQRLHGGVSPPGPGPVLPRLSAGHVGWMLAGGRPRHGPWLKSLARVWEIPWG